ncbi:hypothetical protein [Streptococcus pneumoniae]|uniref:hypothetical protein n=1 Tax=Streptococcus pneumoniae TaxID=1313 RepID=UPI0011561F28|nr:hypothetical protein [Streptococcus pneumoniae]
MKIKEQTGKLAEGLASGCSKHCFEVVGLRLTKSVTYIYGKATLTRFEFDFRRVLTSHKGSWELRNVLFQ